MPAAQALLSSCATYCIPDRLPMPENAPQRPINPYGRSNPAGEQILGATRDLRFHFFIELFHNLVAQPHSQLVLIQFTFVSDKAELLLLASFAEANRCPESFG